MFQVRLGVLLFMLPGVMKETEGNNFWRLPVFVAMLLAPLPWCLLYIYGLVNFSGPPGKQFMFNHLIQMYQTLQLFI